MFCEIDGSIEKKCISFQLAGGIINLWHVGRARESVLKIPTTNFYLLTGHRHHLRNELSRESHAASLSLRRAQYRRIRAHCTSLLPETNKRKKEFITRNAINKSTQFTAN